LYSILFRGRCLASGLHATVQIEEEEKKRKDEINSEWEQVKGPNPPRQKKEKRWKGKIYDKRFWKLDP
jgi:hypothetical protein